MAAARLKQPPVGSASWILEEREQANHFLSQELEDFTFSARNEIEWLNEHMAEIFDREQLNVADVFKTPGKLRAKTPGTRRKPPASENRPPLTDIFAPTPQPFARSPSHNTQFYKQVVQFKVAEDEADVRHVPLAVARQSNGVGKENTDSGYHGMTEDEVEDDDVSQTTTKRSAYETLNLSPKKMPQKSTIDFMQQIPRTERSPLPANETAGNEQGPSEASFVSALEALIPNPPNPPISHSVDDDDPTEEATSVGDKGIESVLGRMQDTLRENEDGVSPSGKVFTENDAAKHPKTSAENSPAADVLLDEEEDGQSTSAGASPERPLLRKSSLTFASLPAREPLTTKKSMGARVSRTSHLDQARTSVLGRSSQVVGYSLGKDIGVSQQEAMAGKDQDAEDTDDDDAPNLSGQGSENTKLHSKISTQRLHEKISLLGQTQPPRPSKSIPIVYPQLPIGDDDMAKHQENVDKQVLKNDPTVGGVEEDDDWIAPIKQGDPSVSDARAQPETHLSKESPSKNNVNPKHQENPLSKAPQQDFMTRRAADEAKAISVSETLTRNKPNSTSQQNVQAFTVAHSFAIPVASPSPKRHADGPLSASKAKLYSVLKSAKGIFASSAGASAQAKLEALSQSPSRQNSKESLVSRNGKPLYPDIQNATRKPNDAPEMLVDPQGASAQRQTRSSTERHTKLMGAGEAVTQITGKSLETLPHRDAPEVAASQQFIEPTLSGPEEHGLSEPESSFLDMPPPPPPKPQRLVSQLQKPRELRRALRPTKELVQRTKPAPVSIRVASQRLSSSQPSTSALSASLQDSLPPPLPRTQTSMTSNTGMAALHSGASSSNVKSAVNASTAKPKALQAAARKKEQDERDAQRKAEQKREIERKRAAKQEEERRAEEERKVEEQRNAAEQQRIAEARRTAQKQAGEQRRLELARKAEQQRGQGAIAKAKQPGDLPTALHAERQQTQPTHPRADLAAARPVSRLNTVPEVGRPVPQPQINPAKPPKRALQRDADDEHALHSTTHRTGPSFQQNDAKRRRTNEEDADEREPRPTMAPPIRHSLIRKNMASNFQHGYMGASAYTHASSSMLKTALSAQHSMQHMNGAHLNDMAKFSNAKIPFAEVPNPPQNFFHATPGHPPQHAGAKSSPSYPPGDSISLPEIATDSEDEDEEKDDETGFRAPSWAASPALRELLSQQQLVDPQSVFGPIAPLQMEEMFKGNPDRLKKFRQRTSSAMWDRGDRVTEEERRRDMEARQRLEREGGWRFVPGGE